MTNPDLRCQSQRSHDAHATPDAWDAARMIWRDEAPPPALEAQLLARFAVATTVVSAEPPPGLASAPAALRRWWVLAPPPRVAFALAASLLVAVGALAGWLAAQSGRAVEAAEATTPFMLVAEPAGNAIDVSQLVRVSVSREAMLDFGIPVPPQQLQEPVRAEMLVGQRGELLAVRFVEPRVRRRAHFH